jgi:hypothetical protein
MSAPNVRQTTWALTPKAASLVEKKTLACGVYKVCLRRIKLKGPIKKMTERSDIHKYSIYNLQFSIPACPG